MSANLRKILLKLKQKSNNNPAKLSKIQRGPLKGKKWLLNISDPNYILGEYEKGQTEIILNKMKNCKAFADFGANSGYFSLLVRDQYPDADIFLFEPLPKNVKIIKTHFTENFGEQSYHLDEIAVGNQIGTVEFTDSGNDSANTYKSESSLHQNYNKIKVKIDTLDHVAEKYGWNENLFIKVDIEGAEADFLAGGKTFLPKYKPCIILATHDVHVPGVEDECLKLAESYGYKCEMIKDNKISGQKDFLLS